MWDKIKFAPLAITFDDVIILPGFSSVEPHEIDLSTRFSTNIELSIPLVSSPMDMVSNGRVASILAAMGGIGVIHRHCSVEEQEKMVRRVKETDVHRDIPNVKLDAPIIDAVRYLEKLNEQIALIIEDIHVLGIIKLSKLNGGAELSPTKTLSDMLEMMNEEKTVSKLIRVGNKNIIIETYPEGSIKPTVDDDERLMVAAACSPFDHRRLRILNDIVDAIVMDVAHFHTKMCIEATKRVEDEIAVDLIIGNIGTSQAAEDIITKLDKVDGFRVGIGSGSICKTSEETGVFAPTLFATIETRSVLEKYSLNIPVIADGGVSSVANALKALALGASAVMCGRYLAGCLECPGPIIEIEGKKYKPYRGMGSLTVRLERMLDRYSKITKIIPEGVEALVPYQGSLIEVIHRFIGGLKIAMGYAGAKSIPELRNVRIAMISQNAKREMSPHSIIRVDPKTFWEAIRKLTKIP